MEAQGEEVADTVFFLIIIIVLMVQVLLGREMLAVLSMELSMVVVVVEVLVALVLR
jgi:hypothetical protein